MAGILLVLRVGEFAGGTWCEFRTADAGRPCVDTMPVEWKQRLPPSLAAEPGRTGLAGLRAVDCFCGLGGWSFALQHSGITDLSGVDNHAGRLRLHAANFPECDCIRLDFHNVAEARRILNAKKGFALATVSSPCQGFSTKNPSDPNRDLFWKALSVLIGLRTPPDYILGENVPNAVTPIQPEVQKAWDLLDKEGYDVEWTITRACEHGVPTARQRLWYVATRRGRGSVCNLGARAAALAGGAVATPAQIWGPGLYYFHPHSWDKYKDGTQKAVYSNARPLRTLRGSAGKLPADTAEGLLSSLDDGPFANEAILSAGDVLRCSGFPARTVVPAGRRELFQVLANAVVPPMA